MLFIFVAAFGLGLIFNAAPGPVFAETIRRGLRGGFRPALAVQIGSLAGDALWGALGLAGAGILLLIEGLRLPVGIAGALYLCWLAWESWRQADRAISIQGLSTGAATTRALRSGMLLSLTNPQNIAYWAALGSALGAIGVSKPTTADYVTFFVGFMTASLVWSFLCAALVHYIFGRFGPRWVRITYRAIAITFLALALSSLGALIRGRSLNSPAPESVPRAASRTN
jgi:chemosensory pili system protein ChpE